MMSITMIQMLVWKSFSQCSDWNEQIRFVRFLFDKEQEQIIRSIEVQRRRIEANKHNNQQNTPHLGNQFETLEILQLLPEGANLKLALWNNLNVRKLSHCQGFQCGQ